MDRERTASGACRERVCSRPDEATSVIRSVFLQERKGLLCELYGLYQELDITSSSLFSPFLRTAPSSNETTNLTTKQIFFYTMRFHKHELCDKTDRWRRRNERWQQRLVWSVDKFLSSTAPAFILGLIIGQIVIRTTRAWQMHTNQGTAFGDDQESATECLEIELILPVKQTQKRQRWVLSGSATQPCVKLLLTAP